MHCCSNDLAVVTLSQAAVPSSSSSVVTNTACLPRQGQCLGIGTVADTAGYGRVNPATNALSPTLKEVSAC